MGGRYEIQDRIGIGGISAVYKAYDRHLQRKVAVKRLLPATQTKLNDPSQACLHHEAHALAKFQHPNVVSVFEFGEDEEGPFAVLELVRGQSLEDIIVEGALDCEDFIEVAEQLLDPLILASQLNMLHRDIKPANIMLSLKPSGRYHVKILDFGMAKFSAKPSTQTVDQKGCFLGSIDFIAPEQVERKPIDQRADLYSLGCVLYYALTQKRPFASPSLAQTLRNHLTHKVTPLHLIRPDLPPALADWVMLLIRRNPNDRPVNARAAMKLFRAAREGTRLPDTGILSENSEKKSHGHHSLKPLLPPRTPAKSSSAKMKNPPLKSQLAGILYAILGFGAVGTLAACFVARL